MTCKIAKPNKFLLILVFGLATSLSTQAATFVFSQAGFPNGGVVSGSFAIKDTRSGPESGRPPYNNVPDGKLSYIWDFYDDNPADPQRWNDEFSNFTIRFSGNPQFERMNDLKSVGLRAFEFSSENSKVRPYVVYRTDDHVHFNLDNADFYYVNDMHYSGTEETGLASFLTHGYTTDEPGPGDFYFTTDQPLKVSEVPLPGALGLFCLGSIFMLGFGRFHHPFHNGWL